MMGSGFTSLLSAKARPIPPAGTVRGQVSYSVHSFFHWLLCLHIAESSFSLRASQGKTGSVNDLGPGCPPDWCLSFPAVRPHSASLQADAHLLGSMATCSDHDFGPGCLLIACHSFCSPTPEITIATSYTHAQQYGPRKWAPRYSAARGILAQLCTNLLTSCLRSLTSSHGD